MQTVVLDANALLMPFEVRINLDLAISGLLGDARCVVPGPILGELKRLDHRFAKAALELARRYEVIQTENTGDKAVLEAALRTDGCVLTNDRELRSSLRKLGIRVIHLRSGTHLVID
ncbi:MAG: twitching motility protein PilT [Candidatus Methanoplasma sp.]|jgi:rRNA-processing protein FCF1|nr:twitching motility protein PilT [Candidatus Methanoplasma sp.]